MCSRIEEVKNYYLILVEPVKDSYLLFQDERKNRFFFVFEGADGGKVG